MKIRTANGAWDEAWVEAKILRLMSALSTSTAKNGVGILVDNSVLGVVLTLACMRLGLRTAICPAREPAHVIQNFLREQGIDILFTSIRDRMPDAVYVDDLQCASKTAPTDCLDRFSSLLKTSGTTSSPKTACIGARAHKASARAVSEYFSFTKDSCWALTLPLFHVSGLSIIFRALHAQATIYSAPTLDDVLVGLNKKLITHLSLVPTQLRRLLHAGVELSSLKAIAIGGDALPHALRSEAISRGLRVYETYGLTETASMVWARDVINNSGGLLPHATMRIDDDGEILVGGRSLFDGYARAPHVHERELEDGFFRTGDLGVIDASELRVKGRKHNRIISGGENIQAEEIERVLELHPAVEQCVVIGVRDHDFGMRPCAVIKWRDLPHDEHLLMDHLRRHVAPYKIPKTMLSWPSDAPVGLKKPRLWFAQWAEKTNALDKSVIVGA